MGEGAPKKEDVKSESLADKINREEFLETLGGAAVYSDDGFYADRPHQQGRARNTGPNSVHRAQQNALAFD